MKKLEIVSSPIVPNDELWIREEDRLRRFKIEKVGLVETTENINIDPEYLKQLHERVIEDMNRKFEREFMGDFNAAQTERKEIMENKIECLELAVQSKDEEIAELKAALHRITRPLKPSDNIRAPNEVMRNKVYEAIGAASMCWETPEGAGIFQSDRAQIIADNLCIDLLILE